MEADAAKWKAEAERPWAIFRRAAETCPREHAMSKPQQEWWARLYKAIVEG